jgi:phage-related protein
MSHRHMLIYDIPDGDQLIHQYLDEIMQTLSELSAEVIEEHLKEVAEQGWIRTECRPVGEGILQLDVLIGYGKRARVLFFETPRGDYLALHAFTVASDADADRGFSIAARRMRDLL